MKYLKSQPKRNKFAGVGHQFSNWQVGAALAEKWGYEFVHVPLVSQRSGGNWDEFLNLGDGYRQSVDAPEVMVPNLNLGHGVSAEDGRRNARRIREFVEEGEDERVYAFQFNKFPGIVSEDVSLLVSDMRRKYRKDRPSERDDGEFRVSFHVRRGDVNPSDTPNRWVPDSFYMQWMRKLKRFLEPRVENLSMYLLSTTGSYTSGFGNFPDFVSRKVDGDPFEDFRFMADSDVLFCGLSNYSILASVYSLGFTFYIPFDNLHYCAWMEDERNPRNECYGDAKNDGMEKFKSWLS